MEREQPNEAQGRKKGCRKVTLQERTGQQSERAREAKTIVEGGRQERPATEGQDTQQ